MTGVVLLLCGLFAIVHGSWRGYVAARSAVLPFVREGEETRALIAAARQVNGGSRLRLAVRNVGFALMWLGVAMYGLYLATVGVTMLA